MSTKNPINQCGLFHASEQSPNSATYYFTHDDTETETKNNQEEFECQDEQDETIQDVQLDEETCRYDSVNTPPRKTVSEDTIRELVNGVEELVTTEMYRKRKSKLRLRNDDSCDASGEDDERDSQYSDYDVSTSTLKGLNNNSMSEGVLFPEYKANDRNRKLYGSCTPLNQTCSTPRLVVIVINFRLDLNGLISGLAQTLCQCRNLHCTTKITHQNLEVCSRTAAILLRPLWRRLRTPIWNSHRRYAGRSDEAERLANLTRI